LVSVVPLTAGSHHKNYSFIDDLQKKPNFNRQDEGKENGG
jgi:hypothetical protein